jgi:hypothetical protein
VRVTESGQKYPRVESVCNIDRAEQRLLLKRNGMTATAVRLLQLVSIAVCVIVIASFGVFVLDQTKGASSRQQEALAAGTPGAAGGGAEGTGSQAGGAHSKSAVHEALDEASNALTSPFAGLVSGDSEWAARLIRLALALALYGFGIGYLVRVLRVRV